MSKRTPTTPAKAGEKDFVISGWAFALFPGDPTTAKLLDKLAYLSTVFPKSDGFFYRSKNDLLHDIGIQIHENTLTRKLTALEKQGFLSRRLNRGMANFYRVEWEAIGRECRASGIAWNEPSHPAEPQDDERRDESGTDNPNQTGSTESMGDPHQSCIQYDLQREHLEKEPRRTLVPNDSEPLRGSSGGTSGVTSKGGPSADPGKREAVEHMGKERKESQVDDESPPASDPGQAEKDRYYDWEHYAAIPDEAWRRAENEGVLPLKESLVSLLLGSFVLGVWENNNLNEPLDAADFSGKPIKNAKDCLGFFRKKNHGDELAGFREALEWVRWFTVQPSDSFIGGTGWSMELCFTKNQYRKFEALKLAQRQQKTKGLKRNDAVEW